VFSMHATKLINGFEGGYVTTNNQRLAEQLEIMKRSDLAGEELRQDGVALNSMLNEMHAAMALASLDEIEEQVAANKRKYGRYVEGVQEIDGLDLVEHKASERSDYRMIVVRLGSAWPLPRDLTLRLLEAEKILARPYYTPLHHRSVEYHRVCPELPTTEAIFRDFMALPSGAHVSEDDIEKIIDVLARIGRQGEELKSRWATT